jgi:iron(III) transport system ATP-binding protein
MIKIVLKNRLGDKKVEISIKNVKKNFGNFQALRDISIKFEHGKFTTLLGASGCGKTTLLRIIAGLESADSGEMYFDDQCVFSTEKNINVPPEKRGLGFVFQDFALWPHMTVFENVAFGLRAKKNTNNLTQNVMEALKAVQLQDFSSRYPHQLSGGQQQRVAFARAIAIKPRCILFDEPLSALDAILRQQMRIELKKLVEEREITSIFVTHDQLEAMSMSDEIAVLYKGEILQKGNPEQIYYQPQQVEIAKFVGSANWLNSNQMVRPEKILLKQQSGNEKVVSVKVKSVQFIGTKYELLVSYDQHDWIVLSPVRYLPNQEIQIYINEENIINF